MDDAQEVAKSGSSKAVGTSFKDLLKDVSLEPSVDEKKPARRASSPEVERRTKASASARKKVARPSDQLTGDDRAAYYEAMGGVRPIKGAPRSSGTPKIAKRGAPPTSSGASLDEAARARLAALVSGGVRFDVVREDGRVLGVRAGTPMRRAEALGRPGVAPEATLDLHGYRAAEAARELTRFVRRQAARGVKRCCVVHGKGLHSEAGLSVLKDRVFEEITEGAAAASVRAFATASSALGGEGAVILELVRA